MRYQGGSGNESGKEGKEEREGSKDKESEDPHLRFPSSMVTSILKHELFN